MMWRWLVLLLVLANGGFWLWSQGQLRALGWGPIEVTEPERLKNQLHPEALVIKALEPADLPAHAPASTLPTIASPSVATEPVPAVPTPPTASTNPSSSFSTAPGK